LPRAGARSGPKPRHLGLPDKSHCLERGRFAAQRRTSLLTTTDRGHVPSWLSLCGCGERACPALGREAAPCRHCGGSGKNSRLVLGPLRSPAQDKPAHYNGSGDAPLWLSLRVCGCGERACPALGREASPCRHCGGSGKNSRQFWGRFAAQRRTSLLTTTGRGHVLSWLSLRVCGCGERACPAPGRKAAPKPGASVYQINHIVWSGAASQPSAGQACSLQRIGGMYRRG